MSRSNIDFRHTINPHSPQAITVSLISGIPTFYKSIFSSIFSNLLGLGILYFILGVPVIWRLYGWIYIVCFLSFWSHFWSLYAPGYFCLGNWYCEKNDSEIDLISVDSWPLKCEFKLKQVDSVVRIICHTATFDRWSTNY